MTDFKWGNCLSSNGLYFRVGYYNKFFLEDGWSRFQAKAKAKHKETKQADTRRKEAEERKSLPQGEAPDEFKEFVKTFGKRSRKTKRVHSATS